MNLQIALCLPREAETVGLARRVTGAMLDSIGVDETCKGDIQVALSEACTNVVEHATSADEYEIRLDVDQDQCAIRVIDAGHGYDGVELAQPMPSPSEARGRGLALMKALVDRIELRSEPESGTIVHLVKRLVLGPASPLHALRGRV